MKGGGTTGYAPSPPNTARGRFYYEERESKERESTMLIGVSTYIHRRASGYILAAAWIVFLSTRLSWLGSSTKFFRVSKTSSDNVSFWPRETAGVEKASERKSVPHLRNSTCAEGPIMGRVAWITCG